MAKKTWIKLKRGITEPKHRTRLGIRVWLFIEILDQVNWKTGMVKGWKDKDVAEDIEMPWRTLQDQRQQLEKDGYITCHQGFQCQDIEVHNWTNPREYSGKVYNQKEDTESSVPQEGTGHGTGHGIRKFRTPTSNSQITEAHLKIKKNGAKPPASKKKRDPLLDHPAIIIHKDIIRLNVPIVFREAVVNIVGDSPSSLNRWRQTLRDWVGSGYNPKAVKNILDKFQGGSPKKQANNSEDRQKYIKGKYSDMIEH